MKTCCKCKENKQLSEFYINGYQCKQCQKKSDREHYQKNKEKIKEKAREHYQKNKGRRKEQDKQYNKKNKEKIKQYDKRYYKQNREKRIEYNKKNKEKIKQHNKKYYQENKEYYKEYDKKHYREYYQRNKEQLNRYTRQYTKKRKKTDIQFKLSENLHTRLSGAIKNNQKSGSAVRDLGCTVKFLKEHLESKFQSGMNWENYGYYGWHIDHIIPLSKFNLTDREQLLEACHYTNLQPLWAIDNMKKSNKIIG